MPRAICKKCNSVYDWRGKRGYRLADFPCPHCGGEGRRGSNEEMNRLSGLQKVKKDYYITRV